MIEDVTTLELRARLGDILNRVELRHDQFVILGFRRRDDLAVRIDDAATAEHREAILDAAFRGRDHEGGVLIGAGLHREIMMEQALLGPFLGLL